jgi:hypothetical protein
VCSEIAFCIADIEAMRDMAYQRWGRLDVLCRLAAGYIDRILKVRKNPPPPLDHFLDTLCVARNRG